MADYWYPGRLIVDHFTKKKKSTPSRGSGGRGGSGQSSKKDSGPIKEAINWVGKNIVEPVVNTVTGVGGAFFGPGIENAQKIKTEVVDPAVRGMKDTVGDIVTATKAAVVGKEIEGASDKVIRQNDIPSQADLGRRISKMDRYGSKARYPHDYSKGVSSAVGHLLEFNLHKLHFNPPGTLFDSPIRRLMGKSTKEIQEEQKKHYYEGLYLSKKYTQDDPGSVFTSPGMITLYTIPISWGTGGVVAKGGAQVAREAVKGAGRYGPKVLKLTALQSKKYARVGIKGLTGLALAGAGAVSADRVYKAYKRPRTLQETPQGELYYVDQGGLGAAFSEGVRQALVWRAGLKGAQGKSLKYAFVPENYPLARFNPLMTKLPLSQRSARVFYDPKHNFPTIPKSVKPGKAGQQWIRGRFDRYGALPRKTGMVGRLSQRGWLPKSWGQPPKGTYAAHGTDVPAKTARGPFFSSTRYDPSLHFTRMGTGRYTLDYSKVKPRSWGEVFFGKKSGSFMLLKTKGGHIRSPARPGAPGTITMKVGKHPATFSRTLGRTQLQLAKPRSTEIEALVGARPGDVITKQSGEGAAGFLRRITGTPRYYYEFKRPLRLFGKTYDVSIGSKRVAADIYTISGPKTPAGSAAAVKGRAVGYRTPTPGKTVAAARSPSRPTGPTYSPPPLSYVPLTPSRSVSYPVDDSGSGGSGGKSVVSSSISITPSIPTPVVQPPSSIPGAILPGRRRPSEPPIRRHKQKVDEDYYNELKRAWAQLFGKTIGGK